MASNDKISSKPPTKLLLVAVVLLAVLTWAASCSSDNTSRESPPAEYTKFLVQEAIDRYQDQGRQATFDHYSSPASVNGSWYVFILEGDNAVVNANRPDIVGTSTAERKDINGKPYGRDLVAADENGVWVDYYFTNPLTGEPSLKHTWAVRHDGLVFGSGWYE